MLDFSNGTKRKLDKVFIFSALVSHKWSHLYRSGLDDDFIPNEGNGCFEQALVLDC